MVSIVAPESLNQLIGVVIVFSLTCFAGGMPPLASLDHKVIPLRYFYHVSCVWLAGLLPQFLNASGDGCGGWRLGGSIMFVTLADACCLRL